MVSNASAQLFQYTELFHKLFTRATESGRSRGGCINLQCIKCYPSMNQNVTEGKFMFFDKKLSKSSDFYYLEPGLYPSITDFVEAMNTLIQKRQNHCENCITVKVLEECKELKLAIERSGLALFSMDLGRIFGCNVDNEFGVLLR